MSVSGFHINPAATLDTDRIGDYLAVRNPAKAEEWSENLYATYEFLAQNPELGHTRSDYTDEPVLFWNFGEYLVVYAVQPDAIEILAVQHSSRDIPAFLDKRLR